MYRLIVWYQDGTKEEATYNTEEEARKAEKGFYMAFGNQIAGTLIYEEVMWNDIQREC